MTLRVQTLFCVCVALLCVVGAAAEKSERSRFVALSHLRRVSTKDSAAVLIAVKQRNLQELEDACTSVSTPGHAEYGNYYSLSEVAELVGNPDAVKGVVAWLNKLKAQDIEVLPTNDFVRARVPARALEQALKIQLHLFRHPNADAVVLRANGKYTLPQTIRPLVDHISGIEPVDMENPTTIQPISPRRSGRLAPRERKPGVRATASVEIYEIVFVNTTFTTVTFYQYCQSGSSASETWPCSSTSDPIASYSFVVYEMKTKQIVTYTITKDNAASYNFKGTGYYSFTVPNSVVQYGHYQFNMTSTGTQGDKSNVAQYPGAEYGIADYFLVNYALGVPSLFHTLYNVPASVQEASGNSVAMAAFMGETYSTSDLDKYCKEYNVPSSSKDVTVIGYNVQSGGGETMLDLEMEASIAPNVPIYYIYTGKDGSSMDFLLEWAGNMSTMTNPPLVHSISYGLPEYLYEEYFGIPIDQYAARTNAELQKICVRGITVLVASGDGGSTDIGHGGEGCTLGPMYPASSPWVTTVGATAADTWGAPHSTGAPGEVVVAITNGQFWTSGGGFSQLASQKMPSYQAAAVAQYIKAAPYLPKDANLTQRGFPDISALGDNIMVVSGGYDEDSGGTSASSPMTAAMIAHVNAARLAAGKAAVGFFNPLLYQIYADHPEVIYDVTIGEIACGDDECCPTAIGFPATKGWDAASGVGSINDLQAFVKAALQY